MAKKTTGRTTSKKKTPAKKTPAPKTTTRKKTPAKTSPSTKKTTTKKTPTKKTVAKKTAAKKTSPTKKTPTKKTAAKKTTTKKVATAKKPTSKKTTTVSKKTNSKKTTSTKAAATKKTPTKKKKKTASAGRRSGRSVAEVATAANADSDGFVFINGRRVRMISTKGKVPTRRSRADKAAEEVVVPVTETRKPIKTNLSRKELNHYQALLLIKRAELAGDLTSLEAEALRSEGGNLSHMPIHMADIGSDTYEQDFMLGLAEKERTRMREIDEALKRIADKTYGICQMTGNPIPEARLEAKPWAKYTIEAARQLEQGWTG